MVDADRPIRLDPETTALPHGALDELTMLAGHALPGPLLQRTDGERHDAPARTAADLGKQERALLVAGARLPGGRERRRCGILGDRRARGRSRGGRGSRARDGSA